MYAIVTPRPFTGTVRLPASKSWSIRRLLMASLAEGLSEIGHPLDSLDARSCVAVCRGLGAEIEERRETDPALPNPPDRSGKRLAGWTVRGFGGAGGILREAGRDGAILDAGNSGTTLFLCLAAASLAARPATFTGDEQLRRRSAAPLLDALRGLGVRVDSREGCAPLTVRGPWRGGRVGISCPTSQYLSALLFAAPAAPEGTVTEIDVIDLAEIPYVEMTLRCLDIQGIKYRTNDAFSYFQIPGGQAWRPVSGAVPGDFSAAAFPAAAAFVSGGEATLAGLDPADTQGDRIFFDFLETMGAAVRRTGSGDGSLITLSAPEKPGGAEFDLNDCPDLLPALAVCAAFAKTPTRIYNVENARIKETDRIAVMAEELAKLGVRVEEKSDGLVIYGGGGLSGGRVSSHGDHRIAMALAAGAFGASGDVIVEDAECAAVTWPGFFEAMNLPVSGETVSPETVSQETISPETVLSKTVFSKNIFPETGDGNGD